MYIILGANGHVGSAAAETLLADGERVTAVLHSEKDVAAWQRRGAETAVVDIRDSHVLNNLFKTGRRAFLLNPPADVSKDTDREEHVTLRSIVAALENSGLEKVVLESVSGAQRGERCGDLTVLYDFEQALAAQSIPFAVQRAAYYMSNWDELVGSARQGTLPTMLPADLKIPMVAPIDLGRAAAARLREPPKPDDLHYVEGPERYSAGDVAAAFSKALNRPVEVVVTPRDQWLESYRELGFSDEAARSYAKMTAVTIEADFRDSLPEERGKLTLEDYISELIANAQ